MADWLGAVAVPLIVAGIGWLGLEFTGGIEGRQQRKVLGYLQIARELGDTPEGRGALRVARSETSRLLEERGTKAQLVAAVVGFLACAAVTVMCVVVVVGVVITERRRDAWTSAISGSFLAVVYALFAYRCWANIRRVQARRAEQRPSTLVLGVDVSDSAA